MNIVMKNALRLFNKYKDNNDVFIGSLADYLPLPSGGGYPVFKNYPNDSVEYSAQQRAKILLEEEQAKKKAQMLETLREKTQALLQKEVQFREQ